MPWITPNTLTSTAQRQSFTWCSHSAPSDPDGIAALLHTRCTAPNASRVASRSDSTDSSDETSVTTPITASPHCAWSSSTVASSSGSSMSASTTFMLLGEEPLAQRTSDSAAAAGDDGDLAPEVLHGKYGNPMTTDTQTERYTVISADCHAGADLRDYRPFLEAEYLDEFDDWADQLREPVRRSRANRTPTATGTARVACATSRPTASSPR